MQAAKQKSQDLTKSFDEVRYKPQPCPILTRFCEPGGRGATPFIGETPVGAYRHLHQQSSSYVVHQNSSLEHMLGTN